MNVRVNELSVRIGLHRHDAPPEEELTRFENSIGAQLPADFRIFLTYCGGQNVLSEPRYEFAEPTPWGKTGRISRFLGLTTEPALDIESAAQQYAGRIPDETIPVAADPADNLVLLGVEGMVRDRVMFWDHEHRELSRSTAEMADDLEAAGEDLGHADVDAIIALWRKRFGAGTYAYENVYPVAATFSEFLAHLGA